MRKKKWARPARVLLWLAVCLASMLTVTLGVPALLVKRDAPAPAAGDASRLGAAVLSQSGQGPLVPVFLSKLQTTEQIPLEAYVEGVVAAEMPIEFEPEALKAQALASRTYIVRRILEGDASNVPVNGALVTDTVAHQAFATDADLRERWGAAAYTVNMAKLRKAVAETKDQILLYDGKPINATFFSTSNGYTENSEDYWPDQIPYLRSVPSPWDAKLSPRFKETTTIGYKTALQKLGVSAIAPSAAKATGIKVLEWSAGHRIKSIRIGGKTFTGRDVREKLGLPSSQFTWAWKSATELEFTTYGYGHGVGLSQWGANGMAKEGRKAEDIVKYYYTGIQIGKAADFVSPK
ncbi:stage II sporulation protein D [Paenibacillus athensensis]|uniref:Stage II sporulation protein D n=1 Tax=Paenibacillus athensensis TaxID=1967502 RepID=A0A4Y8Q565_9BACL|nr:stage II sporulation protein D [Paenibacillus athensensis]MCD1260876.1 stage II sporulation protein D [Paenibacillus athensensis]